MNNVGQQCTVTRARDKSVEWSAWLCLTMVDYGSSPKPQEWDRVNTTWRKDHDLVSPVGWGACCWLGRGLQARKSWARTVLWQELFVVEEPGRVHRRMFVVLASPCY